MNTGQCAGDNYAAIAPASPQEGGVRGIRVEFRAGRWVAKLRPAVLATLPSVYTCARAQLGEQVDRHARAAKRRIPDHDLAYQPILGRRSGRAD
jgi:hypothetical protein